MSVTRRHPPGSGDNSTGSTYYPSLLYLTWLDRQGQPRNGDCGREDRSPRCSTDHLKTTLEIVHHHQHHHLMATDSAQSAPAHPTPLPFHPTHIHRPQPDSAPTPPLKRDLIGWWKQFKRNGRKEDEKGMLNSPTPLGSEPLFIECGQPYQRMTDMGLQVSNAGFSGFPST